MDMSEKTGPTRVVGDRRALDYGTTSAFFEARGRVAGDNPLTATMYQSADLATRRDAEEKARILPLLSVAAADRVLDLGCGTGRWAEAIAPGVDAYLGIDFSEALLDVARTRAPKAVFQSMNVAALDATALALPAPFTVMICSGILIYINDDDIRALFRAISSVAAASCRIYLREPMAVDKRLTLDRHWSDELQDHYSAIYRTRDEYVELFADLAGFQVRDEGEPFSQELQNRADTRQRYMLLSRSSDR
jgi:SAM-dependent methyltransferase